MVTKIDDGKINKIYDDEDAVILMDAKDIIYVYEVPDDQIVFPVYCSASSNQETTQFGYPFLLGIPKDASPADLYPLIMFYLERYSPVTLFEEEEPLPDLFTIQLFESDYISVYPFEFPLLDTSTSFTWIDNDRIQQGQGVVLAWNLATALQLFGSSKTNKINTEFWFDYEKTTLPKKIMKRQEMTLEACLDEYTHEEHLSGQDAWYCSRCKKLQRASKKIDIWKLPEIMVIHLKRFSQVRRWGNKVDDYIDFPLTGLDMTTRVLQEQEEKIVYDLYAVDNHYGGMHGGHCKDDKL
jgi:hypothetical protein